MIFRLAVWNCNMRLHEKIEGLRLLRPDVIVVPECACPEVLYRHVPDLGARDMAWVGQRASKGLAVFSFGSWRMRLDRDHDPRGATTIPLRLFGPASLHLLAVWAIPPSAVRQGARRPEPLAHALRRLEKFIALSPVVIAGDFNSTLRPPSPLARRMAASKFACAVDATGAPRAPTFFRHRQAREPASSPSDRIFLDSASAAHVVSVTTGSAWEWTGASDHAPVVVTLTVGNESAERLQPLDTAETSG